MVDASIVPTPKQRNTREKNEAVKRGETPAEWERKPAKNRQKDKDARWTRRKKHGRSFFGYKNHVNVDRTHKLIRRYAVTDAAVHDSRKLNGLLHQGNTSHDVFGDSAYRSAANEATLKGRGFRSRIHVSAARGHLLSKAQAAANRAKSRIRARIEHVFGAQEIAPDCHCGSEQQAARDQQVAPGRALHRDDHWPPTQAPTLPITAMTATSRTPRSTVYSIKAAPSSSLPRRRTRVRAFDMGHS